MKRWQKPGHAKLDPFERAALPGLLRARHWRSAYFHFRGKRPSGAAAHFLTRNEARRGLNC
jgi:hypothetical protein